MAHLFDIYTDACDSAVLTGTLQILNDYHTVFPRGPEFALQLIADAWWSAGESGAGPVSAATEAEFAELQEFCLGRKVHIDENGYLLAEDSTKLRMPSVKAEEFYRDELDPYYAGPGTDEKGKYILLATRPAEFTRRTSEIIVSYQLSNVEWPDAEFTIEVSDARYLEHLAGNVSFKTAFNGMVD
ncbi:hypothetical protein [Actinophytocola sediminis]